MFDDHDEYQVVRLGIAALICAGNEANRGRYWSPAALADRAVSVTDALLATLGFVDPDTISG